MIIGHDFFTLDFHGNVFDTAISTSHLDEVVLGAGIYDELYVTVDTTVSMENKKPEKWQLKTIMDAKFKNDLEAGSLDADGHIVTKIQIYRRKYLEEREWLIVGQIDYDENYNVYSFIDRFAENGATYEYAIVPIANKVIGDITVSEPIEVDYDGVFISDINSNFKLEIDFNKGSISHNTNMATSQPLNSPYPILMYGKQKYQSGSISFLPLTERQILAGGAEIDGKEEREYREKVIDFLENGGSKVIRNDNGEMLVIGTHDVQSSSKNGRLQDLSEVSFNFTEIGKINNETMTKSGLIGVPSKSKYTFDENGEIQWNVNPDMNDVKQLITRARNSFSEEV